MKKHTFKVGDSVKRIKNYHCGMKPGDIGTVCDATAGVNGIRITEFGGEDTSIIHASENFELVETKQMEKRFKNRISVTGSVALLKAFGEELESLGYKPNYVSGRFNWIGRPTHILTNFDNYQNEYGYHNHAGSLVPLDLPKDWDEALKLAAEVEVIVPEYVEWVNYIGSGKTGWMCDQSEFKEGKIFCTSTDELAPCGLDPKVSNWPKALTKDWYEHAFIPSTKEAYEAQQVKPLKVGQWYKTSLEGFENLLVYCEDIAKTGNIIGYGFNSDQRWVNSGQTWLGDNAAKVAIPATENEVEEALLAYAKKMYPVGTKYKNVTTSGEYIVRNQHFSVPNPKQVYGEYMKGCLLYYGKWAEIVDQTIKVKDYVVEKIDINNIKVGCKYFKNVELYEIENFLKKHGGVYTFDGKSWSAVDVKTLVDFIEQK